MNPVEVFATVAQKQYALLEWLNAVDSSYRETEIEFWPQRRKNGRRGWTSHDVRRQQFAVAIANASLSNLPTPPRHMLTRVEVGLKILPSLRAAVVEDAGNAAIRYCTIDQPHYTSVAEVVFELMVAHRDWVEFIAGNGSDDPRITDHYRDLCNELGGMRAMMTPATPNGDPRKCQAIELWDAGEHSWREIATIVDADMDHDNQSVDAFKQEVRRYAKATGHPLRKGTAGSKKQRRQ